MPLAVTIAVATALVFAAFGVHVLTGGAYEARTAGGLLADTVRPIPRADRFAIKRVLAGYAYPVNGNFHNPTPRYEWLLLLDGKLVDRASRRGTLVEAARRPAAAAAYSE